MTDRRKSMTPYHQELLLFLRMNKDLWSAVDIQTIIDAGVVVVPDAEHPVVEVAEHNEQEAAGDNGQGAELV